MQNIKNRFITDYGLTILISLLIFSGTVDSFGISLERLSEIAIEDAKIYFPETKDFYCFLEQQEILQGIYRCVLAKKARNEQTTNCGIAFAIYEIDAITGRVWRRNRIEDNQFVEEICRNEGSGYISIHGVLRNIPGYILNSPNFQNSFIIWAEAGGRVVATQTELLGSTVYLLKGIPATAGTVTVKAKIRGYDLTTLHPGITLNPAQPIGIIGGIDIDFSKITPILRDVRIIVRSNGDFTNPSFPNGAIARVIVRETGHSADGISNNGWAEVLLAQVPTGWPINFFAYNLNAGYFTGELGPIIIPEDGNSVYTNTIVLR